MSILRYADVGEIEESKERHEWEGQARLPWEFGNVKVRKNIY